MRRRLIRARRVATRLVGWLPDAPWSRTRPVVELDAVRRRLELLLAAMYGRQIPIGAPAAPRAGWFKRAIRALSPVRPPETLPASDGETLRLPPVIDAAGGDDAAVRRYRLLAIEQGERVMRGTPALAATAADQLERDLFLLRESAAVDAAIAAAVRNVVPALATARADALSRRPLLESLSGAERDVEGLVRQLLAAHPSSPPPSLGEVGSARESLDWARVTAARLRSASERYRGVAPVDVWGSVLPPTDAAVAAAEESGSRSLLSGRLFNLVEIADADAGGRARNATGSSEGEQWNTPTTLSGDREQRFGVPDDEEPGRTPRPGDFESGGAGTGAALPEGVEPVGRDDAAYPEWDHESHHYRRGAVIVRVRPAPEVDPAWATAMLTEHAALVRRVRARFDRLRSRRTRLPQRRDGDELDLAACVRAQVDVRTGHSADDRLYLAVRPARREMAIALLVDVSGSTDSAVTSTLQVIDVEKIALLLASEALEALGDRYAVFTFSGKGATGVRVTTIKAFVERNGPAVHRRISALQPEANTRLGAAVRHATAMLDAEAAGRRLLLILSDGKPNDVDGYQGPYGIEDARQAIIEARARDVYPFCLTVDHEESSYLPRIFGRAGYSILRHPDQLPEGLLRVVKQLLAS